MEVEEAGNNGKGFVLEILEARSWISSSDRDSGVTILQQILHSRKFDIDTFRSSFNGTGDGRRNTENHMAQGLWGMDLRRGLLRCWKKTLIVKGKLFKISVVKALRKKEAFIVRWRYDTRV